MKEKTVANSEQYRAVLDDLLKHRNELQFKMGEIDAAVVALRRLMPPEAKLVAKASQQPLPIESGGKYTGMSVRWAVLALLTEDALGPLKTGKLAVELLANGIKTEGRHFDANVSAVLSKMNRERNEIEATPEGWIITETGKQSWIHIKASRERHHFDSAPSAIVH